MVSEVQEDVFITEHLARMAEETSTLQGGRRLVEEHGKPSGADKNLRTPSHSRFWIERNYFCLHAD
jgi:hypothetical protein